MVSVGFSVSDGWLSKVICWLTKSKTSHAWLLLDPPNPFYGQQKWVLEATADGYRLIPYEGYAVGNILVAIVPITYPGIDAGVERAMGWIGGGYDYGGLVGDLFVLFQRWLKRKFQWLKFKVRNPLHQKNTMYCSEAITFALQDCGFPGASKLVGENTSPQDLYMFLTANVVEPDQVKHAP